MFASTLCARNSHRERLLETPKIVVVGSVNIDHTVKVGALPKPGETIMSRSSGYSLGGKGFNQAVSARRFGGEVALIARVGRDPSSETALASLDAEGVERMHVAFDEDLGAGSAVVVVADDDQNMIVVSPGANGRLDQKQIQDAASMIGRSRTVVAQLETPIEAAVEAFALARAHRVRTILNPAPAAKAAIGMLDLVDIVTPNFTELCALTEMDLDEGDDCLRRGMQTMVERGVRQVVVTLGRDGCAAWDGDRYWRLPAFPAAAVDPTGAGDVFNGVLAAALTEGMPLAAGLLHASAAAALSVAVPTANCAPERARIEKRLADGDRPSFL